MPRYGQCSLLGARSECLGRHDPRARASGVHDDAPTKKKSKDIKMIKMEKKDAQRIKRNRARSDRRRRAHQRLMAAEEKVHTKMQQRGGTKKWRQAVKRRYQRDLQREKQRKKRRQELNRQIWQRLQAIVAKAEETATSLLQLSNEEDKTRTHPPGEELIDKAMAAQHWVAIGEEDINTAKASAGRKISDGMLFRVAVSIAGRRCVALIDSGASQSYIAPETVALCELECEPAVLHLELANGSKIKATQQTKVTTCTVGEAVSKINFTVTNLLSNVDLVLGMDWLVQWNPVIDWRRQILNLYVNRHWTQVFGTLLDSSQQVGTVKILDPYAVIARKEMPEWVVPKAPKVWDVKKKTAEWQKCIVQKTNEQNSDRRCSAAEKNNGKKPCTVNSKSSKQESQRSIISSKRMDKLLSRGADVYLAVVMPSSIQGHGVTQKIKQQIMKEKGPIRKAPPVADTRSKMCKEAPVAVRAELQGLLKQYEDVFPEQLPKGKPPKRTVEFEINTEEGATPPNKPPYRLSPKEHEELQAQIEDLLAQGHIRPSTSPYGAPVLFVPKKDGRWRMCVDYRALNRQTIRDRYPLPRIDDLLDRLGKAKHFTTLDLATGYHQIAVKNEDIPKTAFRTQRGQFEFVVMPFGVTNAPATFQRMMNSIFKEELDDFVLVYLDDILIFSETLQEHIEHIKTALEKLRTAKLYARLHKCAFFQKKSGIPGLRRVIRGNPAQSRKGAHDCRVA